MDQDIIDAWLDLLGSGINQVLVAEPEDISIEPSQA